MHREQVKTDSGNIEQVHSGDIWGVIAQEGEPSLAWRPASLDHEPVYQPASSPGPRRRPGNGVRDTRNRPDGAVRRPLAIGGAVGKAAPRHETQPCRGS